MYSPKIKEKSVKELWRLKQKTKKSMARMANEAIEFYLKKEKTKLDKHRWAV